MPMRACISSSLDAGGARARFTNGVVSRAAGDADNIAAQQHGNGNFRVRRRHWPLHGGDDRLVGGGETMQKAVDVPLGARPAPAEMAAKSPRSLPQ